MRKLKYLFLTSVLLAFSAGSHADGIMTVDDLKGGAEVWKKTESNATFSRLESFIYGNYMGYINSIKDEVYPSGFCKESSASMETAVLNEAYKALIKTTPEQATLPARPFLVDVIKTIPCTK